MLKKKEESPVSHTVADNVALVYEQIKPLELNLDFGREDLNQAVGKLQDKVNELIKKAN